MSEELLVSVEDQALEIRDYLADKLAEYPLENCCYASLISGATLLLVEVLVLSLSGCRQHQNHVENQIFQLLHDLTTEKLGSLKESVSSPGSSQVN